MKKWFVKFPTYQYNEDVKALAKENDLKIIDDAFQGDEKQCENAPKLTLIEDEKPKGKKPLKGEKPKDQDDEKSE